MPENKKRRFFNRRKKQKAPQKVLHNYAFIDAQNLNLGTQRVGWKMDWKKFRQMLADEYDVQKAYMFIGYLPDNESLYKQMQEAGYLVVLKPTLDMFYTEEDKAAFEAAKKDKSKGNDAKKDEKPPTKGNVDAELVMYVVKEMPEYKKAIIVSGDGDFYSLIEYLQTKDKLLHIMAPNMRYSSLLKPFEEFVVRLDTKRRELSYGPVRRRRHSNNKNDKKRHSSGHTSQPKR